ncbi:hypothetical protein M405DRAFT_128854 [Rhizopogon salebrosus TDB-379]|nr:hypothetical protein M405DRAFT_128854 [Rhizopogon salebrosus TDB-379]
MPTAMQLSKQAPASGASTRRILRDATDGSFAELMAPTTFPEAVMQDTHRLQTEEGQTTLIGVFETLPAQKPFKCTRVAYYCGLSLGDRRHVRIHSTAHKGPIPVKCSVNALVMSSYVGN